MRASVSRTRWTPCVFLDFSAAPASSLSHPSLTAEAVKILLLLPLFSFSLLTLFSMLTCTTTIWPENYVVASTIQHILRRKRAYRWLWLLACSASGPCCATVPCSCATAALVCQHAPPTSAPPLFRLGLAGATEAVQQKIGSENAARAQPTSGSECRANAISVDWLLVRCLVVMCCGTTRSGWRCRARTPGQGPCEIKPCSAPSRTRHAGRIKLDAALGLCFFCRCDGGGALCRSLTSCCFGTQHDGRCARAH